MTGERIEKKAEPEVSFDPMTGERIEKKAEPEVSFDPMTGERIEKKAAPSGAGFDPMTGRPVEPEPAGVKKGFKVNGIVMGIIAAVAVVVIVVACGISSGAFLGKADKILLACVKTSSKVEFLELEDVISVLGNDKYTIEGQMSQDDDKLSASYRNYGKDKGLVVDYSNDDVSFELQGMLSKNDVKVQLPDYSNKIFSYNYKEEKTGYLADEIGEDNLEIMDNMIEYVYDNDAEKDAKKLSKDVLGVFRDLKFTKASKKSFDINGKDKNCKGYTTTIGADEAEAFLDVVWEYYKNRMRSFTEDVTGEDFTEDMQDDINDAYDDLEEALDELDDFDVTIYLYKGYVAAFVFEIDGVEVEMVIHNPKSPLEEVTITAEYGRSGDIEIKWKGEMERDREQYTLRVAGERVLSIDYNKKEGNVEFKVPGSVSVDIGIQKVSGGVCYEVDGDIDGDNVRMALTVSKKTEKLDMDGDVVDIGNLSEDELEEIGEEIEDGLSF